MATVATDEVRWLAGELEDVAPSAKLSGIVGDLAHKKRGGYHISRQDQPSTNYSVRKAIDKKGPGNAAAGIDINLKLADMKKIHGRFVKAFKARDPRLKYLNAWNGWDGEGSAGRYECDDWDVGTSSADHKWHMHFEIHRAYVENMTAMRAILSVAKGETLAEYQGRKQDPVKVTPKPVTVKPKDNDNTKVEFVADLSVGSKGSAVKNLQAGLNRVFPKYSKLKVDGDFGELTRKVVVEYQDRSDLDTDGIVGVETQLSLAKHGITLK